MKRWFFCKLKLFFSKPNFKYNWRSVISNCDIGEFCDIGSSNLDDVVIGDYSYINSGKVFKARIGKFCSIGQNVKIGGFAFHPLNISTHPSFFHSSPQIGISFHKDNSHEDYKIVEIGHDVWIGDNVSILDGSKIGTGSILGAGTIVAKDIPPYSIVVGSPGRVIRNRFSDDEIAALLEKEWWNLPFSKLSEHGRLIGSNDVWKFVNSI